MVENNLPADSRRGILKKGAVAASAVAGGMVLGSGSAAADTPRYVRVQGEGEYDITIYGEDSDALEVTEHGIKMGSTYLGNGVWNIWGEVDGALNVSDGYAQFLVDGYEKAHGYTDSGVDLITPHPDTL